MDLGTVLSKIELGYYRSLEECSAYIFIMYNNILMYNVKDSLVYEKVAKYKREFLLVYIVMRNNIQIETETDQMSRKSPSDNDKLGQFLLLYHLSKYRNLHSCYSFGCCDETRILWEHMAKYSDSNFQMKN